MDLILELNAEEVELCRDALGTTKFISPRDTTNKQTTASLCKRLSDALKDPQKHHAYNKPRMMDWTRKAL